MFGYRIYTTLFPIKDEALAFISDIGGSSVGTTTQAYTPTKYAVSRDNSLKREVLNLKACVQGMRKKFDDFVEQQKTAFEDIEGRTDMILLAIEGTPSGSDLSVSTYSRVHISWNEVFSKILKKPSILQK